VSAPGAGRVVVVDDNRDFADNLVEILRDAGYATAVAHGVAEAAAATDAGFDVALVDVHLPDGDGMALAQALKQRAPESEVVLLTGFASVESAAAAVRVGACAYLVKPCATPELLLTVTQAMRQARSHAERRSLAQRAHTAERLALVGTLTAGLSHEIRNPLNAAALQLQVLERRVHKLAAEQRDALLQPLTLVRDEIRRLDHILEDFLQFARPRNFVPQEVDLVHLARTVVELLSGDAERRGVALSVAGADAVRVSGDDGRLRQVAMNLTLNAMEALDGGRGRVRLTVSGAAGDARLIVEDSGPGVPGAVKDRLFEPFYTTKARGSGLGLAIVHSIVQQHGGGIVVGRSDELGGARFEVRLPRG